ncbi:glycosyltransferase [Acinetobacter haemolyticus]|uniref:glycosyltransferase n=1 Tax=Acinetobacter haemolyticus TaxID=29430 RepID=UPI0013737D2D|nr:glycosyltransferase [Acinetobacter haemolyticus]NAR82144.1 glycosyltransferase [Acinetobacter haemolyticus]
MKILVLVQDYPSLEKPYAMSYVHSRNIEYKKAGHEVKIISFSTLKAYLHDSLEVSLFDKALLEWSDIIVSHAPNVKNHVRALRGVEHKKIVFFFHGHEVLNQYGDYPKPYAWKKVQLTKILLIKCYDFFKIKILHQFLKHISGKNKIGLIFVSEWMKRQFIKNIKLIPDQLGLTKTIPNACNSVFLESTYQFDSKNKLGDCITIRPLDDSKYAVDLVVEAALNNPEKIFHIYGKGSYFDFNKKPENIFVINQFIQQKDIPDLLNKYKIAFMPTRYDAQGVMVCEMATYGIPVVTTDFEVCVEMLSDFSNVSFVNEKDFKNIHCNEYDLALNSKILHFDPDLLIAQELDVFDEL